MKKKEELYATEFWLSADMFPFYSIRKNRSNFGPGIKKRTPHGTRCSSMPLPDTHFYPVFKIAMESMSLMVIKKVKSKLSKLQIKSLTNPVARG